MLWKSPWELRHPRSILATTSTTEEAWLEHYDGGWQEIFPNGGDACVYKGCHRNFHDEASVLPWDYSIACIHSSVNVEFTVSLYRSPFRLRLKLTVEPRKPVVRIQERIFNRGEEDMHFIWGHHPAYGSPFLEGDCHIQLPGARLIFSMLLSTSFASSTYWPKAPEVGSHRMAYG